MEVEPVPVPPHLAEGVWRHLRTVIARHCADGGQLLPGMAQFLDDLRAAGLAHRLASSGHPHAPSPDIRSSSEEVHTDRLAGLLGCTDRHARRVARAAGLKQTRRGYWAAADVAALLGVARARR